MRVVCDAGPLIHLARAGHFDLLRDLFGRVPIPPAVYQEVAVRGKGEDGSKELVRAPWIQRRHPRRSTLVAALATFLGSGEAEAIAFAGERPHSLLLIDETHGRRVARNMRIGIRGTRGILLQGFRAGHVPDWKRQSSICANAALGLLTTWLPRSWPFLVVGNLPLSYLYACLRAIDPNADPGIDLHEPRRRGAE